jgi:hypothetical protein
MSPRTDSVCLCRKQPNMRQATPEAACLRKLVLASKVGVFGRVKTLDLSARTLLQLDCDLGLANNMQLRSRCRCTCGCPVWERLRGRREAAYTWRSRNVGRTAKFAFQCTLRAWLEAAGCEFHSCTRTVSQNLEYLPILPHRDRDMHKSDLALTAIIAV